MTGVQTCALPIFALYAAVPAPVVIGAVGIAPAVALIVLLVVGIQVVQRESVMAGEEVHAGIVARVIVVVVGIEAAVEAS